MKPLPGAAAFLGMGLSAAVSVGIGVGLGLWADSAWHTAPALLVVGLILGVAAAVLSVVGQIRKYL
jgi:F0F1-type ATP synthase assembly protein I